MRVPLLLSIFAVFSIACVDESATNAQQAAEVGSNAAIDKLLTQRRDILAKRVDMLAKQYARGATTLDTVVRSRDQLFDAELQLVVAKDQRVLLYQKRLDNMRELENTLKGQFNIGMCALEATLSATAGRLQAEIDLLRECHGDTRSDCPQKQRMESEIARALAYSNDSPRLTSHVVIGRLVFDGSGDAQQEVKTQMDIWPEGYFVTLVGNESHPLSFRAHGYFPLDVSLREATGQPLDLGTIHMRRLVPAEHACLTGALKFEGGEVPSKVVAAADIVLKRNTPGNHAGDSYGSYENTRYHGRLIPLELTATGEIRGSGFSPAEYELTVSTEGYVTKKVPLRFQAGETLDLGTVEIEKPKHIHLVYTGTGLDDKKLSAELAPDERWRPPLKGSWSLHFKQEGGKLRLLSGYGPWYGNDLGAGDLADFAGVEKTQLSPEQHPRFEIKNGHVYFIKMNQGQWLCFEVHID